MKSLPPLNYIRSFEASARHLTFTKAAEELGLTQAAVSGHVRALEQYIGRPLFIRVHRSLSLTEVAAAYLPPLRKALAQISVATAQIHASPQRQEVKLACPASLAMSWLPQRLTAFAASHPEIDVSVHATIWSETVDKVVDVIITPRHMRQPLIGHSLGEEELVALCPPAFLTGPDAITCPQQIGKRGLIHLLGRQEHWEAFADYHRIPDLPLSRGPKTDCTNVALAMAAAGLGSAITLASLAEAPLRSGSLVAPFARRIPTGWGYDLHHGALTPSRASDHLMQFLLSRVPGREQPTP